MTRETKKWWEYNAEGYQKESKIPIGIHYGPSAPYEDKLKILGNLREKEVLEIGCGGAQCGIAMAKKGARVTGMDISEKQLEFAKKLAEKNKVKIKLIQKDFKNLKPIKSNSKDIVFSAFALLYADNLLKTTKEVYRVLKKNGTFVFSIDNPIFRVVEYKDVSYFDTGKVVKKYGKEKFVMYRHTISDLFNILTKAGFTVERIIEADSRKKYKNDPWYGLWNYVPKNLNKAPPTIIFKARKK